MGVGRIALGALGAILLLSVRGLWTGRMLIGFRAVDQSGSVTYGLSFGTPDTFNADRAARLARTARPRAIVVLLVGATLVAGLFSEAVHAATIDGLKTALIGVLYGLLAVVGIYCVLKGLIALWFGPKPGVAWVRVGRGTLWVSNFMTREQTLLHLKERNVIRRLPAPRTEFERFADEGAGGDPLEQAGANAFAAAVPVRLQGLLSLSFGVVIFVHLIARFEEGGPLEALWNATNAVVWVTAGVVVVRALASEHAPEAMRAVWLSALGLGIAWLVGITPGPIDAFETIRGWI